MQKRTPWYPVSIKPVRAGYDEIKFADHSQHQSEKRYFDGKKWRYAANEDDCFFGSGLPGWDNDHWRGLINEA